MKDKLIIFREKILRSDNTLLKISIVRKVLTLVLTGSFIRYLIIGFSTFFLQIALLYFINIPLGLEKIKANIFSTLIAMVYNFSMSNFWTFKAGTKSSGKKIGKYLLLAAFNYVFDTIIAFPFLAGTLGINQYLVKVIITGIVICWNFIIYKLWVFKQD